MESYQTSKRSALATFAVVSAIAVSGCGGGGGSGSGSTGSTPPPPTTDPGNLLTVIPTTTYAANSRASEMYAEINAARGTEFGYVRQSAQLDTAANSHSLYLQTNTVVPVYDPDGNQYTVDGVKMFELGPTTLQIDPTTGILGAHSEQTGLPGFTGRTPSERTTAAGYPGSSTEVVASEPRTLQQYSQQCVANLINTVFHRGALLNPSYSEVGMSRDVLSNVLDRTCVISLGSPSANPARTPTDWSGAYPLPGAVGIPRAMWNREAPDPAPEIAVMGSPISIFVKSGALTVTKFTLTGPQGVIGTKLITTASSGGYLDSGQAFLVPTAPLARNTKYTAEFVGTAGSKELTRTWSFTTVATDGRCDDGKTFGCN